MKSHQVSLREDEKEARGRIETAFESGGLAVPSLREVVAGCGVHSAKANILLQAMFKEKTLVRVSADLVFHRTAIDRLREQLQQRRGQRLSVGAFKDWTGVSRKYAIPLLEFLDRERLTRRDGEDRLIL
jgi:selenocysteine-specific elongation factor